METYKGEEVIESLEARLYPTDNRVPECSCVVRLTSMHIFVSEDNYDGTFDDHYVLDLKMIEEVKIGKPFETSIGAVYKSDPKHGLFARSRRRKNRRGGSLYGPASDKVIYGEEFVDPNAKVLEIVYHDDNWNTQHIYFDECKKSPKAMIKAYNDLKS